MQALSRASGAATGLALAAALLLASPAQAAEVTPALLYDMGGKFDQSFNQAAYDGAEAFKKDTGIAYLEFEPATEAQREQALRKMAQRGANIIVAVGFAQTSAVETVAAELPEVKFTLIDGVAEAPNIQSIVFKEHEGSFLVGMLAAMATKSGKIGFVGGQDVPLIRKFACGYEQGAKHVDASTEVLQNMTGNTPAAWNDPTRGGELAVSQFDRGADVIFAAAGSTGLGVYQAAKDRGKLAIGVDSNQNHLQPGAMLTSMVKRVDVAVAEAFKSVMEDSWSAGFKVLGLAEDGVAWSLDEHNEALITEEMKQALALAEKQIVVGQIAVADYMADNACSY